MTPGRRKESLPINFTFFVDMPCVPLISNSDIGRKLGISREMLPVLSK